MKKDAVKALKFTKISDKELMVLIETPKNPEMGDYAFPCFTLVSKRKNNPHEIAREIASKVRTGKVFEKIEAVGPYVNFFISRDRLAKEVVEEVLRKKERFGRGNINEKVVIEFPSPNTNKPLHLGHARNIALGQSVAKICEFLGSKVKIVNLNNDRGIHICKSMIAYEKFGMGNTPKKAEKKSDHFVGGYYVKFAEEVKRNKELEEEAKTCLQKWEKGNKKIRELWKKMNSWALSGFQETYKLFELKFDKEYFESDVYNSGKEIVLSALKKGKAKKKFNGAIFVDLNDEGLGEKILLRADGTSIYITQDLYLAVLRQKDFKFDRSIYVTASEQDYHFKVLFSLLRKFGYSWADKLFHLNYGMVHLESGRMKSREGNVVDIDDLAENMKKMALEEVEKRYEELNEKEKSERAFAIAMAALRYYFLKVEKIRDLTFKPEASLSFEGDTGPYLLYSYARAKSILKKAGKEKEYRIKKVNDWEKRLLWEMSRFGEVVRSAYDNLAPNLIANYSFQLAQIFSEFYHRCPVIGAEEEGFRLKLVECFSIVISNALNLLNIKVIEKM